MKHCYCTLVRSDTETRRRPQHGERWLVQCAQSQECWPSPYLFQWLSQTSVISTTWIKRREIPTTSIQFLSHLKKECQNRRRVTFSRALFPPILKVKWRRRFVKICIEIKDRHAFTGDSANIILLNIIWSFLLNLLSKEFSGSIEVSCICSSFVLVTFLPRRMLF